MSTPALPRVAPQAPAPLPLPEPSEPAAHPFAELLKQNRAVAAEAPPADGPPGAPRAALRAPDAARDDARAMPLADPASPAPPAAPAAAEDASAPATSSAEDTTPPDAARARTSASKLRPRTAPGTSPADGNDRAGAARATREDRGAVDRHAPAAADGAGWLASGMPGTALAAAARDGTPDAGTSAQDDAAGARRIEVDVRAGAHDGRAAHATDAPAFDGRAFAAAHLDALAPGTAATAPAGNTGGASVDAALAAAGSMNAAGGALASAPPTAVPPPVEASVATPVSAAGFAQAFAIQVSVLATDGVQRAELHLNPAELGPVSVHIALDGQQARVEFGADTAATRHAIEAGLPELASALRDAGFTLTGGGVAAHAGGQGRDANARDGAQGPASPGASRAVDASVARRDSVMRAGGIDLYA